jgi:hypothetical protein
MILSLYARIVFDINIFIIFSQIMKKQFIVLNIQLKFYTPKVAPVCYYLLRQRKVSIVLTGTRTEIQDKLF